MVEGYEGNVGSGKTYHAVKRIVEARQRGQHVITDIWIAWDKYRGRKPLRGQYQYMSEISLPGLVLWDRKHHHHTGAEGESEHETLVVIDEVYNYFDPRDFDRPDRALWMSFLKVSRHYHFDFVLVGQDLKTDLDKKIYRCLDYTTIHKALARLQIGFQLLVLFTGKWFLCTEWVCSKGAPKIRVGTHWVHLRKRVARMYNTHQTFDNSAFARQLDKFLGDQDIEGLPLDLQVEATKLLHQREMEREARVYVERQLLLEQLADCWRAELIRRVEDG